MTSFNTDAVPNPLGQRDASPAARLPRSIEETGLPFLFLVELVSKVLFLRGQMKLTELARHLKLADSLVAPVVSFMRIEKLCELSRSGDNNTDAALECRLTDSGRNRASEQILRNGYAGPAPVPLEDYCRQVEAQRISRVNFQREQVARRFAGITIAPRLLDQLGSAMNSGRAIFLYGPAGSGKTYIAEHLGGLLEGDIWVPHALLVDGQVVQMFDPSVHHLSMPSAIDTPLFDRRFQHDQRWVRCKRPVVLTGGELNLDMLEFRFDSGVRYYQAPPHLKANNGIFIIDDLGRQRCSATELMNRWIVPLERRQDFCSLHNGHKCTLPFDVIVVFSSNFPPSGLGDDAFMRRLGYKIRIGEQDSDDYLSIFQQMCAYYGVSWTDEAFRYLLDIKHRPEGRPLLACYPRDLISQVSDRARYNGIDPVLNEEVIDWAWENCFGHNASD